MPEPYQCAAQGWINRAQAGWLIAGLAVLAALAIGNFPLLSGSAAPQWDAVDLFAPSFSLVGDEITAGRLLKWNPWTGAGAPDWAEPEFGTTSPVLLAASFLSISPQEGYVAYWLAVWAFGGIGMLLLARHLGAPPWGGAIAAFGFVASGFYTGHAEHMSSVYAVSFVPWILWRLDAGLCNRDWWCGVQTGVLYGLSALGGYPAFAIMTPGFLFLWALGRVLWREAGSAAGDERAGPRLAATLLTLTLVVGILISSLSYFGLLTATRGYTNTVGPRPRDISISSNLLAAGAISTFASPYLADLNLPPKPPWPETDVSMTSIYTGAASLVLAIFGLRRRSGWSWWLALMAAFALCCALGSQLPLRGWLYDFVPPTRYFRNPALFRAYVILMVGILAALATRDLAGVPGLERGRARLWMLSMFCAFGAVVSFAGVSRIAGKSLPQLHPAMLHLVAAWFGLPVLAYFLKKGFLDGTGFLRAVALLAFFDAIGALFISQPTMYTAATLPWWRIMNTRHSPNLDLSSAGLARDLSPPDFLGSYPNNRNTVIKTSVLDSYIVLRNRSPAGPGQPAIPSPVDFQREFINDPDLSRMAVGRDRLWFSAVTAWRAPDNASFKLFQQRVHELHGLPILELHSPEQMLALTPQGAPEPVRKESLDPPEVPPCVPAEVSSLAYAPNSLSFQYTAPQHGYLLVTDRWADGWEVAVNGRSRPVLGANFIFRAVEVDAGTNLIAFSYKPRGFWPLLFVSWGTLLLATMWQCRRWLRSRNAARVG